MKPKVSVVMPAYNAGKYIGKAFDSLISQTFTDWECLVVNDCSTDDTLKLIEEYAAREPRIKYKSMEKNTGSAKVPRDSAIAMANSEWIVMLDSDDTLATDVIEKLVARQAETGADIVLPKMVLTDDENGVPTGRTIPSADFDMSQIITGLEAAKLTIGKWEIGMAGGMIPKRIYDNRHTIKNYVNADEYDSRQILIAANKVAFVDAHYIYRNSTTSITKSFHTGRFDILYTNKLLQELIEANYNSDDDVVEKMKRQRFIEILRCRYLLLQNANKLSKEEYGRIGKLIEEHYKDIQKKDRKIRSNSAIKKFFLTSNYTLFKLVSYAIHIKSKKKTNER